MIFSRLFRPGWTHPDAKRRLVALAKLDASHDEERRTLRELAFNDGDRQVRLAALGRLDTLELWYLAGHQDADPGIRKLALAKVSDQLCSADFDDGKRADFVGHCKDSKLVESLWRQLPSPSARRAALTRLNKERLFADAAENDSDSSLRQWAAGHVDDGKLLQKLVKKAADPAVASAAQARLDEREAAVQQLAARREQLRLLLAQLLAWSDKLAEPMAVQQPELAEQCQGLLAQWQALRLSLDEEQQAKGDQLARRLEERLALLQEQWQARAAEAQRQQAALQAVATLEAQLNDHVIQLETALTAGHSPDLAAAAARLDAIDGALNEANLSGEQQRHLRTLWQRARHQLAELADYDQRLAAARELIAELAATVIADDSVVNFYPEWQNRWAKFRELTLPQAEQAELGRLRHDWQQASRALRQQVEDRSAQIRRLFARMAESQRQGRLKLILRDFEQCRAQFEALPEKERLPLQKRYDEWAAKANELNDWHEYVARPKQEDLVTAIEALASAPLSDPTQQASEVRELRQQWRTLSAPTGDPVWQALADRFEQASEKAFAPCREYYAQLEQEREANRQARDAILGELEALLQGQQGEEPLPQNELESRYRKLTRRWQASGEVDYTVREGLNRRYRQVTGQIGELLRAAYQQNFDGKSALIAEAERLLSQAGRDTRDGYRNLHQRWREIGYAGPQDQGLWQRFAAIGDQLREADEAARQARNAEMAVVEGQIEESFALLESGQGNEGELLAALHELLEQLPPRRRERPQQAIDALLQARKEQQQKAKQAARYAEQRALIEVLEQQANGLKVKLASGHKYASALVTTASGESRHDLTIELELAVGLTSPIDDAARRQGLQLQRLKNRLEQGGSGSEVEQLLRRWLACGPVSSDELPLVARLAKVLGLE